MTNPRIVLDTNVLLVSIPRKSKYRPIFDGILNGKVHLVISNDIILEYTEILERKANSIVVKNITELLTQLPNAEKVDVSFKWNLIKQDPDDNKFVDCAITGRADYIVTNDNHFSILQNSTFPKVNTINADEFLNVIIE